MAQTLADRTQDLFGDIDRTLPRSEVKDTILSGLALAIRGLRDAEPDDAIAEASLLAGEDVGAMHPIEQKAWTDVVHAKKVVEAQRAATAASEAEALEAKRA